MQRTDIVDWPKGERDGYVFTEVNTVVNAFHIAALQRMAVLAQAVGEQDDAAEYSARAERATAEFQRQLLDEATGLYRDGAGTDHSALHANFFPLAFDIAPAPRRDKILAWLNQQDMNCSVYAAQYLLEALFQHGSADRAVALITARNDRSWRHMVESGTTISWEAWDLKYKPNQDWNHAWGAAPANLLPRFVLGAQPLEPGWRQAVIRPCPAGLTHAEGKIPTVRGPLLVAWQHTDAFEITVTVPGGMTARLELPASAKSRTVTLDGQPVAAQRQGDRWIVDSVAGKATLRVQ